VKRYRDFTSLMLDAASKHFDVAPYREQWRRNLPEGPPTVYTGALGSSRRTGAPAVLPDADQLLQAVRSGKFLEKLRAIKAMAGSGDGRVGVELIRLVREEPDLRLRKAALEAMAPRGDPEAAEVLCDTFENDESLRHYAAAALAGVRHLRATEALRTALESADVATFQAAGFALAQQRDATILPTMLKVALAMPEGREAWNDPRVRVAWTLLFSIGEPAADALVAALDHPNNRVRLQAALTLPESRLRDTAVQGRVIATLEDVAEALTEERAMVAYHLENMRERLAFMNAGRRRR
jgi:HEAT repeat protein